MPVTFQRSLCLEYVGKPSLSRHLVLLTDRIKKSENGWLPSAKQAGATFLTKRVIREAEEKENPAFCCL